ncbi:MAG: reverse transcriptase domain-containing protein, partial [Kangiellaceae bacterium]|nr:reverse transcriptase domain-containing protein [Kangiellaceae bacterium]
MIGSVAAFEEGTETWTLYQERLEQFFAANDIADGKKRAVLLSTCGKDTFQLIDNLLSPTKPADATYSQICAKLKEHFDPTPPELVLRFRFYTRCRQAGESVAEFLAELRKLARNCNFGDNLESMLRDRLALGINDDAIQSKLFAEKEMTLNKAFSLAQAHESATRGTQLVSHAESRDSVHAVRQAAPTRRCFRCLSQKHVAAKCPFLNKKCFNCSKLGHTAAACRSPSAAVSRQEQQYVQEVEAADANEAAHEQAYSLHHMADARIRVPPIETTVIVNGSQLRMEVDTGASVSLISADTYETRLRSRPRLEQDDTKLRTYSGELVSVLGRIQVRVEAEGATKELPLLVVEGAGSNLIGRDWLACLPLDWRSIKQLQQGQEHPRISQLLKDFAGVFESSLGKYSGPPVHLQLKSTARPRFMKARSLPFALKAKVETQLDREIEQGVLKPVSSSNYASPIVPVLKADGSVRICADFKRTVNLDVEPDGYPLPRIEEIVAKLTGGQRFSKLDLSQAYSQLPLDEESQQICTINTTKGLLRYTRLPFGVAPAVGIFQRRMDCLLQGIPHVAYFIDDLIVTGADDEAHLTSLKQVLERLRQSGLKCGRAKCSFMQQSLSHLWHRIESSGWYPLQDKARAILKASTPERHDATSELLGARQLLRYKFLPNLSTALTALRRLLNQV